FDGIAINGSFAGFFESSGKPRIRLGIRTSELGGNHDFPDQLVDKLALFLRVGFASGLFPLCTHGRYFGIARAKWQMRKFGCETSGSAFLRAVRLKARQVNPGRIQDDAALQRRVAFKGSFFLMAISLWRGSAGTA